MLVEGCALARLSFNVKRTIALEVAEQPSLKSAAALVAGARLIRGKRDAKAKRKEQRRAANAGKFAYANMVHYMDAGRQTSRGWPHANLQLDGTTLSRMDLLMVAQYNTRDRVGFWLPPQAIPSIAVGRGVGRTRPPSCSSISRVWPLAQGGRHDWAPTGGALSVGSDLG